jgi:hypothetical protein
MHECYYILTTLLCGVNQARISAYFSFVGVELNQKATQLFPLLNVSLFSFSAT